MSEREAAAAVKTHPAFWRSSVRAIVLVMVTDGSLCRHQK
jgi:hypothetical protein